MGLECLPRFARRQGQHVRHWLLPSFRRGRPLAWLLPQAKTPEEGVGVVAGPAAWRQPVELVDVAAPEDDVLRLERGDETTDDVLDVAPPLREAVGLQRGHSHVRLEG